MSKSNARKTNPTGKSVDDYIDSLDSEQVRDDCRTIASIMEKATKAKPEMWGSSIIGFGRYTWYGASGKGTEWMITAFAPRKTNITVYLWPQFDGKGELLARLGKHSCGKGCLYIKRLSDVHVPTLRKLIESSVKFAREHRITAERVRTSETMVDPGGRRHAPIRRLDDKKHLRSI